MLLIVGLAWLSVVLNGLITHVLFMPHGFNYHNFPFMHNIIEIYGFRDVGRVLFKWVINSGIMTLILLATAYSFGVEQQIDFLMFFGLSTAALFSLEVWFQIIEDLYRGVLFKREPH